MDILAVTGEDIVVTGMGCVTPLGNEVNTFVDNVFQGKSGISKITSFDVEDFPIQIAGEVKDFILNITPKGNRLNRLDPFIQYGLEASLQALEQAKLNTKNVATILGTGQGGIKMVEKNHLNFLKGRYSRLSPYLIPGSVAGMLAGFVSSEFGLKGPSYSISSTCSTSAQSIVDACRLLKLDEVDAVVAGGSEAAITPLSLLGFNRIKALSDNCSAKEASRPFDRDRDGFVAAEGAGAVVLEKRKNAEARGAEILGTIAGYGVTSDAYHPTSPLPSANGQASAMYKAVQMSNIGVDNIDYINAHGTSTYLNDISESKAINKVFGALGLTPSVSSTKSVTGHLLGAAGVIEFILTLKCLAKNIYPANINLVNQDLNCNVSLVSRENILKPMGAGISNSFGFGGSNCSLVLTS